MTALVATALQELRSLGLPHKAEEMAAYHKAPRTYLGVSNPQIHELCKVWRARVDAEEYLKLAVDLWRSDIHEAQVAAASLLSRARISPEPEVWQAICAWLPSFDAWAIADHACKAASYRLLADPARIQQVQAWSKDESMWVRRAALVSTLPWARMASPKPADLEIREQILGWASQYVQESEWFMQKVVSWWIRELSKRDAARAESFLSQYGDQMKAFARRDASKYL